MENVPFWQRTILATFQKSTDWPDWGCYVNAALHFSSQKMTGNGCTGTPPLTRFWYNAKFYLTQFFEHQLRVIIPSTVVFSCSKVKKKIFSSNFFFSLLLPVFLDKHSFIVKKGYSNFQKYLCIFYYPSLKSICKVANSWAQNWIKSGL